ncbi:DUF1435 domain-containing protein [Intestinirhabdus alba]|uniref:DUF1435 family protein n=1 Tax=Intestinirhabdus alba TaxID=2899544 RepID=A0A6L6IGF1_9ENTR|nr:DUF1435 domain-containing protein [Intestinirhabdus alba]MTH45004.1 DUF1435 family protein [Intestinirhabdus alba]
MLQRALGSGWGVLLPGMFIVGLAWVGLSPNAWKALIISGLLMTLLLLSHKNLRHFVLLPSFVALVSGVMLIAMSGHQG